jgi:hypothetical protein
MNYTIASRGRQLATVPDSTNPLDSAWKSATMKVEEEAVLGNPAVVVPG